MYEASVVSEKEKSPKFTFSVSNIHIVNTFIHFFPLRGKKYPNQTFVCDCDKRDIAIKYRTSVNSDSKALISRLASDEKKKMINDLQFFYIFWKIQEMDQMLFHYTVWNSIVSIC